MGRRIFWAAAPQSAKLSKTGRVSLSWPAPYFLVGREAGPPEAPTARPGLRLFTAAHGLPRLPPTLGQDAVRTDDRTGPTALPAYAFFGM
jgi:hypothetical protein